MVSSHPIQSKKFAAYLVAECTWKVLAALVLIWGRDSITSQVWLILLAIILVAGFVEVGYIIGQAALDKYTQVAEIATRAGHKLTMKGVSLEPPDPPVGDVKKEDKA